MSLRGLTVCVNYGDLLSLTLARNMRHLSECWVITTVDDTRTHEVACAVPGVKLHVTDAFTRHGAVFNKGLAIEEGFEVMGRTGQLLIWDSDILLPDDFPLDQFRSNTLHGARRRIVADPASWKPETDWRTYPYAKDGGPIGFAQLFSAADPAIANKRPWYNVNYPHAGGGDAYFMDHGHPGRRCVLPIDCLHFGEIDRNWFGTDAKGRDMMSAFAYKMRWPRAMRGADPTAVERVGPLPDRVDVPGYEMSTYKMPFEKRASQG